MLQATTIQSEKGLREMINRNLNKEIHPGTKPSVDFIKKILDEAYESGLVYDVTDMRSKILNFAAKSTNQSLPSLKIAQEMKFKSEDQDAPADNEVTTSDTDERLVMFDVEVYPNLFLVCWKYRGSDNISVMINPTPEEITALCKMRLVGFNCRRYDNHILYGRMLGHTNEQLYQLSQKIINNDPHAYFGAAYNLSYADLWDISSVKQTLKKFEVELGIHHMELDLPWDQPVSDDDIPRIIEYCKNDVNATDAVCEARWQDFVARMILSDLSGLPVNDPTAKHTAKIIFGDDRNAKSKFVYTDLSKDFPGYSFDLGKSHYKDEKINEGGYVYAEPGYYEDVAVLDIASMHPTSIEQLNLFGPYTKNFSALKAARIAIKRGEFDEAKKMLGGKLAPHLTNPDEAKALAYALKIVINIVYGMTSAKFDNPFKDPRNKDNIVAKRGSLFMIDLKNLVQERGYDVAHIKTDSIKIPNADPEIIQFVMDYGAKYGYEFEHETTYKKFCLVNDAVYIALSDTPFLHWEAVGAQFQHPYVFKTLFSKEEITFDDLCEAKSVVKGAIYLNLEYDTPLVLEGNGVQYIGRTGLFVPVREGTTGAGTLMRVTETNGETKMYAVAGTKGWLWMEAEMAKELGAELQIDMGYFEGLAEEAIATIEKFTGFGALVRED